MPPVYFLFNNTPTTDIYTLSLHDALPICLLVDLARPRDELVVDVGGHARPLSSLGFRVRNVVGVVGGTRTLIAGVRSEEHTSELQSRRDLVCRPLLEKKKTR